jgi:hypothetical protein
MDRGTWQGDALLCCRHSLPAVGRGEAPQDRELMTSHTSPLTILDVIVMITLYYHLEYRPSVESIIDSMAPPEIVAPIDPKLAAFEGVTRSGRDRAHLLLYEQLSSPLTSILFYVMITTTIDGGDSTASDGSIIISSGAGTSTSSGSVAVSTSNAGTVGTSGDLSLCTGLRAQVTVAG